MGTPGWEGSRQEDSCFLDFLWFSHLCSSRLLSQHSTLGLTRGCSNVPLPAGHLKAAGKHLQMPSKTTLLHLSVTTAEHQASSGSKPLISRSNPHPRGRTAGMSVGTASAQAAHPKALVLLSWGTPVLMRHLSRDMDIPCHQTGPRSAGMHLWQLWDDDTLLSSSLPPSPEPPQRVCPPSHEASLTEESLLLTHPSFPLFSSNTSDHPVPGQSTSVGGVDLDPCCTQHPVQALTRTSSHKFAELLPPPLFHSPDPQ